MMTVYLFKLAFIGVFISWLILMTEVLFAQAFFRFAFYIGIPIKKKTIELETDNFQVTKKQIYSRTEGKFCFFSSRKVFFLSKPFWNRPDRTSTPFPIRCIGYINDNKTMDIVVRIPLGGVLFFMFFLFGWTVGIPGQHSMPFGLDIFTFRLAGWIVVLIICMISFFTEKNRFETLTKELKNLMNN